MQDDSTTVVQLDTAFDEESISKIYFFTTFTDTDPGNAGLQPTFPASPGRGCIPCLLGIAYLQIVMEKACSTLLTCHMLLQEHTRCSIPANLTSTP